MWGVARQYRASAVATMMSTIRSIPLKGGAPPIGRAQGVRTVSELRRVTGGDVRVGVMAIEI
jgi:hypothetical protein